MVNGDTTIFVFIKLKIRIISSLSNLMIVVDVSSLSIHFKSRYIQDHNYLPAQNNKTNELLTSTVTTHQEPVTS